MKYIDQAHIEKTADKLTLKTLKRDGSNPKKTVRWSLKTEDIGLAHTMFIGLTQKVEWEESELGANITIGIAKLDQVSRNRAWSDTFGACKFDGMAEALSSSPASRFAKLVGDFTVITEKPFNGRPLKGDI